MPLSGLLIVLNSFSISIVVSLVVMAILLISSALISGSEVAFFSIDAKSRESLSSEKDTSADRVLELLNKPKRLLATILIANNFINIAIVILSTYIINNLFDFEGNALLEFLTTVVIATFLILLPDKDSLTKSCLISLSRT